MYLRTLALKYSSLLIPAHSQFRGIETNIAREGVIQYVTSSLTAAVSMARGHATTQWRVAAASDIGLYSGCCLMDRNCR